MLSIKIAQRVRALIREICRSLDVQIKKGHPSPDHVHMLVSVPPQVSVSKLMQHIKGKSSRKMQMEFKELRARYWGKLIWARVFFCATVGAVTEEQICHDRNQYFKNLSLADQGDESSILKWCEYVLSGLKREIERVNQLCQHDFLKEKILLPAIRISLDRKWITDVEAKVLKVASEKKVFQANDIKPIFPGKIPADLSRVIRRLR